MPAENLALIYLEIQRLSLLDMFLQVRSKASCPGETGHIWTALLGILNGSAKERKELGLQGYESGTNLQRKN